MPRRRKSKPKLNLVDTGVSLAIANSMTQGLFNANLMDFLTGRRDGVYRAGSDGTFRVTLPELVTGVKTANNYDGGLADIMKRNFMKNWVPIVATTVGLPIAVKASKKFLKPVTQPINKVLKQTGLGVKV